MLLVGLGEGKLEGALSLLQKTCRTRRSFINPTPLGTEPIHLALAAPARYQPESSPLASVACRSGCERSSVAVSPAVRATVDSEMRRRSAAE